MTGESENRNNVPYRNSRSYPGIMTERLPERLHHGVILTGPRTTAETQAQAAADHNARLGSELYAIAAAFDVRDQNPDLPLAAWVAAWLAGPFSDATRTAYRHDVGLYFTWCRERHMHPARAGAVDLDAYETWLREAISDAPDPHDVERKLPRYTKATRARYLYAVKSFYAFGHTRDFIGRDPGAVLKPPQPAELKRRVLGDTDPTEWERIYQAAATYPGDERDRLTYTAIVCLLMDQAWRAGQLLRARIEHLMVVDGYQGIETRIKGGRVTTSVLTDLTRDAVYALIAHMGNPAYGPLLCAVPGKAMSREWLAQRLRLIAQRAGIEIGTDVVHRTDRMTAHLFRRSSATRDLDRGLDLATVAEKLNHESLGTTRRHYDQHRGTAARSAVVRTGRATPIKERH